MIPPPPRPHWQAEKITLGSGMLGSGKNVEREIASNAREVKAAQFAPGGVTQKKRQPKPKYPNPTQTEIFFLTDGASIGSGGQMA